MEYQAAFCYNDVETALKKIDAYVRSTFDESDEEEWCNYCYSLADFMWKHGILTEEIKTCAINMIDSGFGLEIWAQEGTAILNKRKKVLAEFREKLLSPQPPAKKIKFNRHLQPIFEYGDLVAIQLQTADKHYLNHCHVSEAEFRSYDGKYVVYRKVGDEINCLSAIVPDIKEYWAIFQLYGAIFDTCPTAEDLKGIPWADPVKGHRKSRWAHTVDPEINGTFICESSLFYFKKRKYVVIGNDLTDFPTKCNEHAYIFMGVNSPYANTDTDILNIILD